MLFGRLGRHSNRSQHALPPVEQPSPAPATAPAPAGGAGRTSLQESRAEGVLESGAVTGTATATGTGADPAASSATAPANPNPSHPHSHPHPRRHPHSHSASPTDFSSNESLDGRSSQQPQQLLSADHPPPPPQQQQPPPGSSTDNSPAAPQHHYPLLPQDHHPQFSTSADDLQQIGLAVSSPSIPSPAHGHGQHQQQHPAALPHPHSHSQPHPHPLPPLPVVPQQQAPPPERRSTRQLIKGIFTSSSRDSQQSPQQTQHGHDDTSGISRRQSKRLTNAPNFRYSVSQLSSVSVDQDHPNDWNQQQQQQQQAHSPHPQHNQPSPLHGVSELDEGYPARHPDPALRHQGRPDQTTTIRQVGPDHESPSPYLERISQQQAPNHQQQGVPQFQVQQDQPNQPTTHRNVEALQHSQQQQRLPYPRPPSQGQYQNVLPQLHTGHPPANTTQHNFDSSSQVSRDSPIAEPTTRLAQLQSAHNSPAANVVSQGALDNPLPPLPVDPHQDTGVQDSQMMAPPSGGSSSRRSQEPDKAMRAQEGPPPPAYRHAQSASQSGLAPQQNPAFKDRVAHDGLQDQGRKSPQPEREDPEKAHKELLTKYKLVKRLYFENKAQIEQMSGQIEHLQNAIANQRMSQSRTALDDNEYATRFNRLNGAINNLSFNIRKDWRLVPIWLAAYVSHDALKTAKQEMTAVGRAVITRYIVEEVFNRSFHPALNPVISRHLKEIELNIRRNTHQLTSQEEYDALTAKVIAWRMATLEGLAHELNFPEAEQVRADFTRRTTSNLMATLSKYLGDPLPAGVDGSASMIVELAVGIASNIPLESRDIVVRYPFPGDPVDPAIMEVENAGLPPLDGKQGVATEGADGDEESEDEKNRAENRKAADASKVRLAGFVALEVRGKLVLMKAPVWTLA